jgi:hypothetical protein
LCLDQQLPLSLQLHLLLRLSRPYYIRRRPEYSSHVSPSQTTQNIVVFEQDLQQQGVPYQVVEQILIRGQDVSGGRVAAS